MEIYIGSDHAGVEYRNDLISYLIKKGYTVHDCGDNQPRSNYVIKGIRVAENVASNEGSRGIIICGTGVGISIAANKTKGIRAGLAHTTRVAKLAREHNDINILALGARINTLEEIKEIVDTYLNTEFEQGRHLDRIDAISDYEKLCEPIIKKLQK